MRYSKKLNTVIKMLIKEYRICMPITVEEVFTNNDDTKDDDNKNNVVQYKIGQLYMIAKHSAEESQKGEGVEVVENRPHEVRMLKLC